MKVSGWFTSWFHGQDPQASPEQLMQRYVQSGKPAVLGKLVESLGDDLYHFLLSQSDPARAADLSQATWVKVMEKREYWRNEGSFKSWLFTLGRNLLIDELRKLNRWQPLEMEEQAGQTPSLDEQIASADRLAQFNHLLEQLPFLQREAFILQKEGFSLEQIAQITGDNRETVKTRLRYARAFFQQQTANSGGQLMKDNSQQPLDNTLDALYQQRKAANRLPDANKAAIMASISQPKPRRFRQPAWMASAAACMLLVIIWIGQPTPPHLMDSAPSAEYTTASVPPKPAPEMLRSEPLPPPPQAAEQDMASAPEPVYEYAEVGAVADEQSIDGQIMETAMVNPVENASADMTPVVQEQMRSAPAPTTMAKAKKARSKSMSMGQSADAAMEHFEVSGARMASQPASEDEGADMQQAAFSYYKIARLLKPPKPQQKTIILTTCDGEKIAVAPHWLTNLDKQLWLKVSFDRNDNVVDVEADPSGLPSDEAQWECVNE